MSISINCSLKKLSLATAITLTALIVATPVSSQAASFISDRANLQANDLKDGSSLGVTYTFKILPNKKLE